MMNEVLGIPLKKKKKKVEEEDRWIQAIYFIF